MCTSHDGAKGAEEGLLHGRLHMLAEYHHRGEQHVKRAPTPQLHADAVLAARGPVAGNEQLAATSTILGFLPIYLVLLMQPCSASLRGASFIWLPPDRTHMQAVRPCCASIHLESLTARGGAVGQEAGGVHHRVVCGQRHDAGDAAGAHGPVLQEVVPLAPHPACAWQDGNAMSHQDLCDPQSAMHKACVP